MIQSIINSLKLHSTALTSTLTPEDKRLSLNLNWKIVKEGKSQKHDRQFKIKGQSLQ